jgi:RNA polymerase sigma factor (sigma-70 family)
LYPTVTEQDFKYCYDSYFDSIRGYLYYRSGDEMLSSDLAQEVFLRLFEKDFEFDENRTKNLLYSMGNNAFLMHLRKVKTANKHLDTIEFRLEDNDPLRQLQYNELKGQYEKTLAAMPENQRVVFLMSRVEDLTYKEIAERLELSVKAVEKRMSQALKLLRLRLKVG